MYVFLTYPPSQENKISFNIFSNRYVGFFLVSSLTYMELILSVAYSRGQLDCLPNGLPIAGAWQEGRLALLTLSCSAPSEVQSGTTARHQFWLQRHWTPLASPPWPKHCILNCFRGIKASSFLLIFPSHLTQLLTPFRLFINIIH